MVAQLVPRCVQGHGEIHGKGFAQLGDLWNQAGGGHGHAPRSQGEGLGIDQQRDRATHRGQVQQRFSHAHEHDVGNPTVFGDESPHDAELIDDLPSREVAGEAHTAGGAE